MMRYVGWAVLGVILAISFQGLKGLWDARIERQEARSKFEIGCERRHPGLVRTQKACADRAMINWVKGKG